MSSYFERLDSETRDVINYLKTCPEIVDLRIEETNQATQSQINEWEIRNLCSMPLDLKAFYLNQNGMRIDWKFSVDSDQLIPLGLIHMNSLKELIRIGTMPPPPPQPNADPSLLDLEDIQAPARKNQDKLSNDKSVSTCSDSSLLSLGTENGLEGNELPDNESESENEGEDEELMSEMGQSFVPHFGHTSNNFELDDCQGLGKVCLVYRNRKSDCIESVRDKNISSTHQSTEIWFLDRSLQWHYLTNTFHNYYRLLIAHLGLPQWPCLFTQDGLPPFLYQWYVMLAPGRILIRDNEWQKLQFLSLFETSVKANRNNNQAVVKTTVPCAGKIDFNRLFDDKLQKSKTQNKLPPTGQVNGNNKQPTANIKAKSRNSLKK